MRIVDYRGKWCALVRIDGTRRRLSLGNLDATAENHPAAERAAADLQRKLAQPAGDTLGEIVQAYLDDSQALAKDRLDYAWKALKPFWSNLLPEHITREKCREYVANRRAAGRQDGTIRKELTVLRAAVNWASKDGVFEMPSPPDPKDRWLTRAEFDRLMAAAQCTFHMQVFLHLAIATAARKEAILQLTWPQVRFGDNQIWLGRKANGKNRATVPMTPTLRAVLQQAKKIAKTEHVIEYEGVAVKSVRKSFERTVERAKLGPDVTPHVLRHTAAVWMAGAGIPMEKIAQYLGHTDSRITERVYARFAPDHLTDAAAALDVGQCALVRMNHKPVNKT